MQPDFLTLLTNIGLDPVKAGASVVTEQFAISLANEWIETAAQQLADDNMSERPEFIPVTIGGWVKDLHPGDNDITVSEDFRSFINGRTREEINKVTVSKQRLVLIGSLAIFAASALTFGFKEISEIFDLIFGGAAVLLLASASLWLIRAYRNLPGRKEYVRTKGEEQKEEGSGLIQAALSEIRKLYDLWDTEIAKKHSLVEFIHGEASRASQMPILALQAVTPEPGIASPPSPQQKPVNGSGKGGAADMADHDASTEPIALRLPKWDLLPPASRKP